MTNNATLKTGDTVLWRGCFGTEAPQPARVVAISVAQEGQSGKYGKDVTEVAWSLVRRPWEPRRVVVSLDNHHWVYGSQIEPFGGGGAVTAL